jgi:hypothetical protein
LLGEQVRPYLQSKIPGNGFMPSFDVAVVGLGAMLCAMLCALARLAIEMASLGTISLS